MSLRRLRAGEWTALTGALGLLASLFLDWFAAGGAPKDGWTSLGWLLVALIAIAIGLGLWTAVAAVTAPVAKAIAAAVWTAAFVPLVVVVLLVRVVTQPSLGVGAPNALVDTRPGAYAGLLFAAMVAVGGWWAEHDERTDAPESAYTPPPPRPAPPVA